MTNNKGEEEKRKDKSQTVFDDTTEGKEMYTDKAQAAVDDMTEGGEATTDETNRGGEHDGSASQGLSSSGMFCRVRRSFPVSELHRQWRRVATLKI